MAENTNIPNYLLPCERNTEWPCQYTQTVENQLMPGILKLQLPLFHKSAEAREDVSADGWEGAS